MAGWRLDNCDVICDDRHSRDVLLEEVDSDGLLVVAREDSLAVALDHARLAHRAVAHDHNLEEEMRQQKMKCVLLPAGRAGERTSDDFINSNDCRFYLAKSHGQRRTTTYNEGKAAKLPVQLASRPPHDNGFPKHLCCTLLTMRGGRS